MSGLEVLGAFAAASQIVDQGRKIISFISVLYSKIRDAPESIRKRSAQLNQLIEIANLIKGNPALQIDSLAAILRTCLCEIDVLRQILESISVTSEDNKVEKVWKTLVGISKEERIVVLFTNLEREKNSLALCITAIDS
jgi:hypothetical protein